MFTAMNFSQPFQSISYWIQSTTFQDVDQVPAYTENVRIRNMII